MVGAARFRNAHWGVLIVDPASGDTLYAHNAGKLFMPASNQKLLTGATALTQLGAEYRFTTRFAATAPLANGEIAGDLVALGTGDPTFSDTLQDGDYRTAFRAMADSLARLGVRHVRGSLVRGGPAFTDQNCGYGWELDDLDEDYGACVADLFVNEGYVRVRRARTNGDSVTRSVAIRDPVGTFLVSLDQALVERGITVSGGSDTTRVLPDSSLTPLFTLRSAPLPVIMARMMKPSQNQIAELLFKTLGRERGGAGRADSARRVVERQLAAWGADTAEYAVRDGSGMSRHDYVSPRTVARVLDAMRRAPTFDVWYPSLAIGGVDGTLANRMRGTPAERNVHAKTGTVDKARSLSGYVTTADGRMLIFSFLCNNFTVPTREVERVQDAILVMLASRPMPRR
jgi:D-alanyl-D-alanine carboxypeptidase/D-alanyl-D-alanine-endopeptidase (penicillin-binding protein 4)